MEAADKASFAFTECPLAPLQGIPTYSYLSELNSYMNACTSDVHSNLGCGTLGYLVLSAPPATFALLCATPFVRPVNPGPFFVCPTPTPAAAVLAELSRQFREQLRTFREYYDVDKAIKAKIQTLIPEIYYKTLKNKHTGYSQVRGLDILTHLWTEYGTLQEEDIQEFDRQMKIPISGETNFETLVAQIEENQESVAAQNPYSPKQIVTIAYTLVNALGIYSLDCKEWRRKLPTNKKWPNFKTHFALAFKEYRDDRTNAKSHGYANAAEIEMVNRQVRHDTDDDVLNEMQQDTTTALANLASATQTDRNAFATLTKTIADQSAQISTLTAQLISLGQELARLNWKASANQNHNGKPNRTGAERVKTVWDPDGYCWSHGFRVSKEHAAKCNNPKPGHQATATRSNTMNGSARFSNWRF